MFIRSEKRLKNEIQPDVVTVTEKIIMEGTNKDPKLLSFVSLASMQTNADNVDKLVEDVTHHKEKMFKMRDTLVKERGEDMELKTKQQATLSEKERIQREYQDLETDKYALKLQVMILEGENKYFEAKIQNQNQESLQQATMWSN